MRYPKIGLEVNLGGGKGRGGGGIMAWGAKGGGQSLIATYPETFVLISQLEVCQEGGVKKGVTWRTLRVPDRRHGGHGHS